MEFCDTVMEKSWNFVVKILWQPWLAVFKRRLNIIKEVLYHVVNKMDFFFSIYIFFWYLKVKKKLEPLDIGLKSYEEIFLPHN